LILKKESLDGIGNNLLKAKDVKKSLVYLISKDPEVVHKNLSDKVRLITEQSLQSQPSSGIVDIGVENEFLGQFYTGL
jgi:hypothetical protein